ncbi:hypothetical protein COCON_G00092140 [Conger conger]|uniref:Uncharacterized protein n=1 Tax=Conger conger TaxID=82655 RepID=A0A9Q1DLK9_CONCO|nr:protein FAM228A isoform X1 [Conger conger]KAJ8274589.1 hypothetical protein COCON_G00092140 [Conger conger]
MGTKAGTEKGGCEDTPISVSDSKRSCLGNRIPYPTKCVGKLSAPVGWLSHSSMRRLQAILENENQEARLITQRMLDTEKGFVKDLDSYLSHRGTLELRKKELLHVRWTEHVWMPIQKNIRDHLLLRQGNKAEKMRSTILHYLEHCNTKVC